MVVIILMVPAFAAVDITRVSFSNLEYSRMLLNAATETVPVSGTRVTVWQNTGHNSQRWDYSIPVPGKVSHCFIRNAANRNCAITYTSQPQVRLSTFTSDVTLQAIKLIFENVGGSGMNYYGMANTTYYKTLTPTGNYNGASVNWVGSTGKNDQLWSIGLYT